MLKIIAIARLYDEDVTDFYLLGIKFRLIARPIRLWHYFDFICLWGKNAKGGVFFECIVWDLIKLPTIIYNREY